MRYILVIFIFPFLSGCIMLPESYFTPSSKSGSVERPLCHGSVGPKEVLAFNYGGTDLSLKVSERDGTTDLRIVLNISKGSSVLWSDSILTLKADPAPRIAADLTHFKQLNYVNGELRIKEFPLGQSMEYFQRPYSTKTTYTATAQFAITELSDFVIEGLSFSVNGKQQFISPIRFTKKRGIFMYPLNC